MIADRDMSLEQYLGYDGMTEKLPINFLLDGKRVEGIPASWNPSKEQELLDENKLREVYTGISPEGIKR